MSDDTIHPKQHVLLEHIGGVYVEIVAYTRGKNPPFSDTRKSERGTMTITSPAFVDDGEGGSYFQPAQTITICQTSQLEKLRDLIDRAIAITKINGSDDPLIEAVMREKAGMK